MSDIVERLRSRNTEIPHRYPSPPPHGEFLAFECAACGEMVDILDDESVCSVGWRGPYLEHEAADEIERLRALITAWADAYHSVGITISGTTDECDAYDAAIAALRAEVGR